jgi:hypothetical protein
MRQRSEQLVIRLCRQNRPSSVKFDNFPKSLKLEASKFDKFKMNSSLESNLKPSPMRNRVL